MTRRCSHCSHNGHNSRTCPNRGVKLFGVRLTDGSIRKSASMGNLSHYASHHQNSGTGSTTPGSPGGGGGGDTPDGGGDGYGSEDFVAGSSSGRERKKGVPWTEEEHKMFLLGLQKLGKGDWRGISRTYVITRTPTQVASHAQKYFIRQTNVSRRKRRSSLFDMVAEDVESPDAQPVVSHDFFSVNPPEAETQNNMQLPAGPSPPLTVDEECDSMASSNSNSNEIEASVSRADGAQSYFPGDASQNCYPIVYPTYVSPFFPYAIPFCVGYNAEPPKTETHEVLKPTAVHTKSPINVDELVGMSNLTLGEKGPSNLSLKLMDGSTRQSAFHANPSAGDSSSVNSGSSPIHAV